MSGIESGSFNNATLPQPQPYLVEDVTSLANMNPHALLDRFKWKLVSETDGNYTYLQKTHHPCFGEVENRFSTTQKPFEFYLARLADHERMKNTPDPWVEFGKEHNI